MRHWTYWLILTAMLSLSARGQTTSPSKDEGIRNGIAVDFSIAPLQDEQENQSLREGTDALFRFHIFDAITGAPVNGASPAVWMDRQDKPLGPRSCSALVNSFLEGGFFSKPALDLNDYLAIVLDWDPYVTVFDPRFETNQPRRIARISLPAPGSDWVLNADGRLLFVSIPAAKSVAVIDTTRWAIVATVATPEPPRRLAVNPLSSWVWVAGENEVYAISIADFRLSATVVTGAGVRDIALSSDARTLFTANETSGSISVVDAEKSALLRTLRVADSPVSIDYSAAADTAWAAGGKLGSLYAIRRSSTAPATELGISPGLVQLRFAPGGRYALVVNSKTNEISVLDTASRSIIQSAQVKESPRSVSYSNQNAYIQHSKDEVVTLIQLSSIGFPGKAVSTVDLPAGQNPIPESVPSAGAGAIVAVPNGDAVLLANPRDHSIYFYQEGMATTSGLIIDPASPRAVLVLNRSLRARTPGVYETVARLGPAGNYTVALALSSPSVFRCFNVSIAPNPLLLPSGERRKVVVEPVDPPGRAEIQVAVPIRMRLLNTATRQPEIGVPDVAVMVAAAGGNWFRRFRAVDAGDGIYRVDVTLPSAGFYYLSAESRSLGLLLGESTRWTLEGIRQKGKPDVD
jgi:YVTN family beta-propeller protein